MRVLIADDSELILARLQDIIYNYKPVKLIGSYRNGIDTLEALKKLKPDLAIIDIKMPDLSGMEVLHEFRKENITTKIIILTLFSSGFYRQRAMKEGADFFFSKAEDFENITLVIDEMLLNEQKAKPAPGNTLDNLELKTTIKPK